MQSRSAVIVSIDRLGAGHLGPFGNTWLPTPHFNRLASESVLCETALIDSPELADAFRAWWTGRHVAESDADPRQNLAALAQQQGLATLLVTDSAEVAALPLAQQFDEHLLVEPLDQQEAAEVIEETSVFQLFQAASEAIAERPQPILAWIHSRGMAGHWDAPYDLRAALADEDDPPVPTFVVPPEKHLAAGFDPDDVLGIVQAYGGQVRLVDECLGRLIESLAAHQQHDDMLLAVTAPRGYPLGEHHRVGPCDGALYNELVHVPLIVRLPKQAQRLSRVQRLVQPADLWGTIVTACGWGDVSQGQSARTIFETDAVPARRDAALIRGLRERAIRTPAWFLRESQSEEGPRHELFAKPDDRWEANEIASRCQRETALLAEELDAVEKALAAGALADLPPLAESLRDVWR